MKTLFSFIFLTLLQLTSAESVVPNNTCKPSIEQSPILILSVDGAAVRGIAQTLILKYIETFVGRPISEIFDFYSGTSAGSIILAQY